MGKELCRIAIHNPRYEEIFGGKNAEESPVTIERNLTCPYCRGAGKTPYYIIDAHSHVEMWQKCSACGGTGKKN